MPEYSKEEWQRLIAKYQEDMIRQYASAPQPTAAPVSELPNTPREDNTTVPDPSPELPVDTDDELTDIGTIQVRVSTENQAIPIEGAVVTISHNQNGGTYLDRTLITDRSGLTELTELATKPRELSLVPGNSFPYAVYTIDISADGYFPKRFENTPVYGGVTSIQSVAMIPLPEGSGDDTVMEYTQPMNEFL